MLNRLDDVIKHTPEYVFMMIGTNDIGKGIAADETISNMGRIIDILTSKIPECEIYVYSIIPSKVLTDNIIANVNNGYEDITSNYEQVTYIDMYDDFKEENNQNAELFTDDGVHLTGKGFQVWMNHIDPILEK